MNNNHHMKNGSLIIMIILVMTALVAIIHILLRTNSYLVLLAREREIYEKQYHNS
jgi:hypothetical protein